MSNNPSEGSSSNSLSGAVSTVPGKGFSWPRFLRPELVGVTPFILFALMFLVAPTSYLFVNAFVDENGQFTFGNIVALFQPQIMSAYWISIRVSFASAAIGALVGLAIALAVIRGGLPRGFRSAVMTFSGVASNFAGVPLAFAFLATLGRLGLVTVLLKTLVGFDIYRSGFNILSFWGLTLTYLYFQIPLMVVIVAPAIDGLKREWTEAADTLGASRMQFWRYVGLPVLWPNLLGTFSLLFANAFGAIATAYALTGSSLNIVPILLYAQIRGDVLHSPGLGSAMALGMVIITAFANIIYLVVRTRAERWLK
ncbi:MAG: ABC transporter permease subunit [Hyphomicrobiaceae bacterium]|nr:ABC transporter permease subunit [Hyphomicrobiaceae bacterium]